MRPLLLLEINEVPWRVIDLFRRSPDFPHLARFFQAARTFTTLTVDDGELSPWVTWPSLHRGLSNRDHGILNLGQDPSTFKGIPIWEEFRRAGHSIGICGSLQSWPPVDPGPGGFFIPDTFAHDERCIPEYVQAFQLFNLGQVRDNGRIVRSELPTKGAMALLAALPRLGIRLGTLWKAAVQLLCERFSSRLKARRPVFQTLLLWDVFRSLFNPASPPAFSTFFTNHVAGIMHRYWDHVFPEDFPDKSFQGNPPHRATMEFAMKVLDQIIGEALELQRARPELILIFASSMGQDAIHRSPSHGLEATITDLSKFMSVMGMDAADFKPLLAMVPQVAVEIPDPNRRLRFIAEAEALCTQSGAPLLRVSPTGTSVNLTLINPSRTDIEAAGFPRGAGIPGKVTWEQAGITLLQVDPGTAYHVPEGILAIVDPAKAPKDSRTVLPANQVKGMILDLCELARPAVSVR